MLRIRKFISLCVFIIGLTMVISIPVSAQEGLGTCHSSEELFVEYIHSVTINGISSEATATGGFDFEQGIYWSDGFVPEYNIDGYRNWPVSYLTMKVASISLIGALELEGGQNLYSLTDGLLSYTATAHTQDQYADIITTIDVVCEDNVVFATLTSEGEANYPLVIGMSDEPIELVQIPTRTGGFTEEGIKYLIAEQDDGTLIEIPSRLKVDYSFDDLIGMKSPSAQLRTLTIEVLEESADQQEVSLQYQSTIQPLGFFDLDR